MIRFHLFTVRLRLLYPLSLLIAMSGFSFTSYSQQDSLETDSIDFPSKLNYIDFDSGIDSAELFTGADTTKFPDVNDSLKIKSSTNTSLFSVGVDNKVLTRFNYATIEIEKGEIISNILKVFNNSEDTLRFTIEFLKPGDWKSIDFEDQYVLAPKDTLFAPIIIVPSKLINSNTEVVINAFILDEYNRQIGNNFFTIKTKKRISWKIGVEPSSTYYFKNDETSKRFSLNVFNTGNSKQDIFVSYKAINNNLLLKDTNNNIVKDPNFTFAIESGEDTNLVYVASVMSDKVRNYRKISSNNYIPNSSSSYRRYNMFISSSEPKTVAKSIFKKGNKVSFIKLPNQIKAQPFSYSSAPLVVEANIQNILDENVFMSLNFRGFKQLNQTASLSYFAQVNYSNNFYTNTFLQNSPWYIGYFDHNKTVEVGQVNSNIIGIAAVGKGAKVSYAFNDVNRTSVFYLRSPGFSGKANNESFGVTHQYRVNRYFSFTGKFGRQNDYLRDRQINSFSLQSRVSLFQKHFFNLLGVSTLRQENSASGQGSASGVMVGVNYSSSYFKKKLKINLGGRYNNRDFSFGQLERQSFNQRSSYKINKSWDVYFANNYQKVKSFNQVTNDVVFEQEVLSNTLIFSTKTEGGSVQPGLFYDYRNTLRSQLAYRGVSMRYSTFDLKNNYLSSVSIRAGYTQPLSNGLAKREYFTLQFNSIIRYRVWSFTSRYNYGVFSESSVQNQINTGVTPQNIRFSLQNQYQLKNRHFILESNVIYNYDNTISNHGVGLFPEIFYYTNSGWRFSTRLNYTFGTRKFRFLSNSDTLGFNNFDDPDRTYTNDLNVGVSIRKEFGVPIPFVKKNSVNIDLISFYDINGNGVKEDDEPEIEDVVVRLKGIEVITNDEGIASIMNVGVGKHQLNVFSLNDLETWFPNVEDSLLVLTKGIYYLPYTRGIKVYGDVVLDRQKIAVADTSKLFDLSRIKITATNNGKTYETLTNVTGRFEFYMPNGDYLITMDSRVLTNRYSLTRNNLPVTLTQDQSGIYVSFFIVEKRKRVVIKTFGSPTE
ncbi:MAG: hypothetical protein ACI9DK_001268 [Vicingaceae bacterium]